MGKSKRKKVENGEEEIPKFFAGPLLKKCCWTRIVEVEGVEELVGQRGKGVI